jgi:hypothetical protein
MRDDDFYWNDRREWCRHYGLWSAGAAGGSATASATIFVTSGFTYPTGVALPAGAVMALFLLATLVFHLLARYAHRRLVASGVESVGCDYGDGTGFHETYKRKED